MKRIMFRIAAAASVVTLLGVSANAQGENAAGQAGPPVLAKNFAPARQGARLSVTSPAFQSGSALDERFTQDGENMSPPIAWTRGPAGTQSYVIMAEDSGVNRPEPIVHWIIYNIPSTIRILPQETPAETTLPNGAMQGKNVSGKAGYLGPKPPAGQTHPYHFQVFALNTKLNIDPSSADRATVLSAMKGRVLASGDVVANYTGE
jgi:Raf kinase inhibitor-like YbhB/YbcL family protein